MKSMKQVVKFGSGVALVVASGAALAVDVTGAVTAISGGSTAVAEIGVASLIVLAGAAVFKYVRRAM